MNIKKFLGWECYESKLDQLMKKFDLDHPHLSLNQQQEKDKYKKIYALRDKPKPNHEADTFWNKF